MTTRKKTPAKKTPKRVARNAPRRRSRAAVIENVGLSVPKLDGSPWPTLGPYVVEWIEANLVHGPGDLKGEPLRLDGEKKGLIYRMYEVFPKDHPEAGRRRFKRAGISLRKGVAKTEFAALIAGAELSPDAPVRTALWRSNSGTFVPSFDRHGEPEPGVPPQDAYIPLLAYTEEQSDELAYGALKVILELSRIADRFDIGLERIIRIGPDGRADGKAVALATAPDSRDGARTTFQHFDETHRFTLLRLRRAHQTMLANIPKRKLADAWSLETTTAFSPGEGSVAEETMQYAEAVAAGRVTDPRLFFFHRQAAKDADLTTPKGILRAIKQASGPAAAWSDLTSIAAQFQDPSSDMSYLRRVWLNQPVRSSEQAIDLEAWKERAAPRRTIPDGAIITLGFDGARYFDSTGLVATEVRTGFQQILGKWERPFENEKSGKPWEVPENEVNEAVAAAFERWEVYRFYADPPYWEGTVATWAGEHGDKCVVAWSTTRPRKMADAVRAYINAIQSGELTHDGDADFERHIGNCHKRVVPVRDDQGKPLFVLQKERDGSPNKIDFAMAACLSWEARRDAIAAGVGQPEPEESYEVEWV